MFSKTLSRVEIFGNAGFSNSFTRGRTKTEVFNCDDLCSLRDAIVFNIVLAFSCGQAKMIRQGCAKDAFALKTEKKSLRFQKYPDTCRRSLLNSNERARAITSTH